MKLIFLLFLSISGLNAQEVIQKNYNKKIVLTIIQVDTDSFETYILTNENYIDMQLVCAQNPVYDHNKFAMIRLKNFYGEWAYNFKISHNNVCLKLGRFIEVARAAVDASRPFKIVLDREKGEVTKIVYPDIDPLALKGNIRDLYPKKKNEIFPLEMSDIELGLD